MGIDVSKLANRLKQFENEEKQSEASKYIWKPKEGHQAVRIVPYKFNPENPFMELSFYYKLGGKNYLAPCGFGKPDPILEFVETLRSSGVQTERELARKLEAKSRTYAPVVVRGEEEQGVKFWGFGVTVYKQLLRLMTDPEWGDIASLTDGNDVKIEFKKTSGKKSKDGQSFPETIISLSPRKTPAVDPANKELTQKIKDQIDIITIWNLPSYEELKDALDRHLNPELNMGSPSNDGDEGDETSSQFQSKSQAAGSPDLGQAFADFFDKKD
jgi:hypothetical protein